MDARKASEISSSSAQQTGGRQPAVRKVNGYLVYLEDVLGVGQYGKVCKAQLATDVKSKINKVYACKIMEVAGISQDDMDCISKEVRIHNMVKSE